MDSTDESNDGQRVTTEMMTIGGMRGDEDAMDTPDDLEGANNSCEPLDTPDNYLNFYGEQVSHKPPISAFYAVCPAANIAIDGSFELVVNADWGFLHGVKGIHIEHKGHMVVHDLKHNEKYKLTLPDVYASHVWNANRRRVDFVGEGICLSKTYSANVSFLKAGRDQERFRVLTSIRQVEDDMPTGISIHGSWRGLIKCVRERDNKVDILYDATPGRMPREQKQCMPISNQCWRESRRLWRKVTRAMEEGRDDDAVKEKNKIEERHRRAPGKPTHFVQSESNASRWRWARSRPGFPGIPASSEETGFTF